MSVIYDQFNDGCHYLSWAQTCPVLCQANTLLTAWQVASGWQETLQVLQSFPRRSWWVRHWNGKELVEQWRSRFFLFLLASYGFNMV